jgi:hypothetical protein
MAVDAFKKVVQKSIFLLQSLHHFLCSWPAQEVNYYLCSRQNLEVFMKVVWLLNSWFQIRACADYYHREAGIL